jgi:hypothetical protein
MSQRPVSHLNTRIVPRGSFHTQPKKQLATKQANKNSRDRNPLRKSRDRYSNPNNMPVVTSQQQESNVQTALDKINNMIDHLWQHTGKKLSLSAYRTYIIQSLSQEPTSSSDDDDIIDITSFSSSSSSGMDSNSPDSRHRPIIRYTWSDAYLWTIIEVCTFRVIIL